MLYLELYNVLAGELHCSSSLDTRVLELARELLLRVATTMLLATPVATTSYLLEKSCCSSYYY
jgi:hypothetical protein